MGNNIDTASAIEMNNFLRLVANTAKKQETYIYKGNLNKTDYPDFINICKLSQKKLKKKLLRKMKRAYGIENVFVGDGYIYCKGDIPVLLTAHMDTVHKEQIKDFYEEITEEGKHIISSPQGIGGDDRCGIYMILQIIKNKKEKPYVLFCEDEEIGGIGSDKFTQTEHIIDLEEMKFLIELDRANANDLIFYEDVNIDFHEWCEKVTGYKENWGSFSDICNLSPECGIASVNISCGYYYEHTLKEIVIIEEMLASIEATEKLLDASEKVETFEFVQAKWNRYYDYNYDDWYGYSKGKSSTVSITGSGKYVLEVWYYDNINCREDFWTGAGETESELWMNFFFENETVAFMDIIDNNFYSI